MNFLSSYRDNIEELKIILAKLLDHPTELDEFIKTQSRGILDMIYDVITDKDTPTQVKNHCFRILTNLAWKDVIEERFFVPSIEMFLNCQDIFLRTEIAYYLTNVYLDDNYRQILIESGYIKCLPMYIRDWNTCIKLSGGMFDNKFTKNAEGNIIINMMKLYVVNTPEYCTESKNVYKTIFELCSNLSYNDITSIFFIKLGEEMYYKYDDSELHNEIIFFLTNVYIDNKYKTHLSSFDKMADHFITSYPGLYTDTVLDVIDVYQPKTYSHGVLDVCLQLLRDNVHISKNFKRIKNFMRDVSDAKDACEYVCSHTISRNLIQTSVQTDNFTYILTQLYANYTGNTETELPCQFFYNHFILSFLKNRIYPKYHLFGLSNVLVVKENYSFIDMNCIVQFLILVFTHFSDDEELYQEIYHVVKNLHDARHLVQCLSNSEFINVFNNWMRHVEHSSFVFSKYAYDTIKIVI